MNEILEYWTTRTRKHFVVLVGIDNIAEIRMLIEELKSISQSLDKTGDESRLHVIFDSDFSELLNLNEFTALKNKVGNCLEEGYNIIVIVLYLLFLMNKKIDTHGFVMENTRNNKKDVFTRFGYFIDDMLNYSKNKNLNSLHPNFLLLVPSYIYFRIVDEEFGFVRSGGRYCNIECWKILRSVI